MQSLRNEISEPSSNPAKGCLRFTLYLYPLKKREKFSTISQLKAIYQSIGQWVEYSSMTRETENQSQVKLTQKLKKKKNGS